jgi:hypothetical protein
MKLVCNATTPQELREEIVALLLHRAAQKRSLANTTESLKNKNMHNHAAYTLETLAGEVKAMELTEKWPAGLTEADDPLASDGSLRVLDAATKGREEWHG